MSSSSSDANISASSSGVVERDSARSRADQIGHRLFHKFALVVADARVSNPIPVPKIKVDRWFNLDVPETDTDAFKAALGAPYRAVTALTEPLAFEMAVVLQVPELANGEAAVLNGTPIQPTRQGILLERWKMVFEPVVQNGADGVVELATVYKQGISLFRSLFALVRVLPAWSLFRRKRGGLQLYVHIGPLDSDGSVLDFVTPLSSTIPHPTRTTTHFAFPPVAHPAGTLSLSVRYLPHVEFSIATNESLLSNRFMQQERHHHQQQQQTQNYPEFTPTVLRHHGTGSPAGSLPVVRTTNLPPPPTPQTVNFSPVQTHARPASALDRFIVPVSAPERDTTRSQSALAFPVSPTTAQGQGQGQGGRQTTFPFPSGPSVSPKLQQLILEDYGMAGSYRARRDSSGTPSADIGLGSSPAHVGSLGLASSSIGAAAGRRSSTSSPFKSNTLSSSIAVAGSSLRGGGAMGTGTITASNMSTITASAIPGASSRASPSSHRPLSSIFSNVGPPGSNLSGSPGSSSPIALGVARPSVSGTSSIRPSPPGAGGAAVGSLDRRSDPSSSVPSSEHSRGGHKRYSSTFGHRYAQGTGTGQSSSPGTATPAGINAATLREAELAHFVSALDSTEPLRQAREASVPVGEDGEGDGALDSQGEEALRAGAIRTGAADVRSELARRQEAFADTLSGLEKLLGMPTEAGPSAGEERGVVLNSPPISPFKAADVPGRRRDSAGFGYNASPSPLGAGFPTGQTQTRQPAPGPLTMPAPSSDTTRTRRDSADATPPSPFRANDPFYVSPPSPFRTSDPFHAGPPSPTPPIRRRPDSPLSSPGLQRHPSTGSGGSSPLARHAQSSIPPTARPSALSAGGSGGYIRRETDSPLVRELSLPPQLRDGRESPGSQGLAQGHESPYRAAEPPSPYRDSDDDLPRGVGGLSLRRGSWRPRRGGGGGTDSDGERVSAGGSASDLVVGRMDL